jgi:hypothetical protein
MIMDVYQKQMWTQTSNVPSYHGPSAPRLPLQDGQEGDAVHGGVARGIDSREITHKPISDYAK